MFTGYVPEAEKPAHYNLADVFLFPSAMEGFGLAMAEAMSTGLPVRRVGPRLHPELVEDGKGGFVRPGRAGAFVERLACSCWATPRSARRSGAPTASGSRRIFRWERCVDGTLRVYETALEAWRRRGGGAAR